MPDLRRRQASPESRQAAPPRTEMGGAVCGRADAEAQGADAAPCPSCGSAMRIWANYHRCRNCGYKESCCF